MFKKLKVMFIAAIIGCILCAGGGFLAGQAFGGNLGDALSTKGDPTIGIGEAPWQHRLLYPMNDRMMWEIRAYVAEHGVFKINPFMRIMYSYIETEDGVTIMRLGRLTFIFFFFPVLTAEEMVASHGDILSALTAGTFAGIEKKKNRFPMTVVISSNNKVLHMFAPGSTPSIYSSVWRKRLFNFYIKYVNPDWMKDSYANERKLEAPINMFPSN